MPIPVLVLLVDDGGARNLRYTSRSADLRDNGHGLNWERAILGGKEEEWEFVSVSVYFSFSFFFYVFVSWLWLVLSLCGVRSAESGYSRSRDSGIGATATFETRKRKSTKGRTIGFRLCWNF